MMNYERLSADELRSWLLANPEDKLAVQELVDRFLRNDLSHRRDR